MTTATAGLAVELKQSTAQAHEKAEHSTFMSDLLEGRLGVAEFTRLQEQAWLFYTALEQAADAVRASGFAESLLDPALNRAEVLARDLDKLNGGSEWRSRITASPAVIDYVNRLEEIRDNVDGPALVAHHYVRYLGDLSGGQVIARMMQRHYGVDPEALGFYHFEGIDKLKVYKDEYREKLNNLELSDEQRENLLKEATDAFVFNHQVFADLGKGL